VRPRGNHAFDVARRVVVKLAGTATAGLRSFRTLRPLAALDQEQAPERAGHAAEDWGR